MPIDVALLPRTLRPFAHMIADYTDERGDSLGDGVWVYLTDAYFCDYMDCRTIHEDTVGECARILKGFCRLATNDDPK